jgi:preprotein translocase subunit SecF
MTNLKIIKNTKIWLAISIIITSAGLLAMLVKGFNYGIDFTGGNMYQLEFTKKVTMKQVQDYLGGMEKNFPQLKSRKVQISGDNVVIIRTPDVNEETKSAFLKEIKGFGDYKVMEVTRVDAVVGKELAFKALNAIIIGSLLIVVYVTIRFKFSYAVGGIVALIHDALVAAGFIALFGFEIDGSFIAAILTILGYSINDTIVVYDRTRENTKKHKEYSLADNIDLSINQVLGRSINTVVTVLFALLALYLFGGDSLKTFTVTLLVGVTTGAYSSIFVASPIVWLMDRNKKAKGV